MHFRENRKGWGAVLGIWYIVSKHLIHCWETESRGTFVNDFFCLLRSSDLLSKSPHSHLSFPAPVLSLPKFLEAPLSLCCLVAFPPDVPHLECATPSPSHSVPPAVVMNLFLEDLQFRCLPEEPHPSYSSQSPWLYCVGYNLVFIFASRVPCISLASQFPGRQGLGHCFCCLLSVVNQMIVSLQLTN
jgi:hypothetical protein